MQGLLLLLFSAMNVLKWFFAQSETLLQRSPISAILPIIWALAAALIAFTSENLWLDPWLQVKSNRLPSLVPLPESDAWLTAFAILGVLALFLIVFQILILLDRRASAWRKSAVGVATLFALLLFGLWCVATATGKPSTSFLSKSAPHSVNLRWQASTSPVDGYNIYRSRTAGGPYTKLNVDWVKDPSFTDRAVESGATYYYVVTAVDHAQHESRNSNEIRATIPK
jgi:amino acid transporter